MTVGFIILSISELLRAYFHLEEPHLNIHLFYLFMFPELNIEKFTPALYQGWVLCMGTAPDS